MDFYTHPRANGPSQHPQFDVETMMDIASNLFPGLAEQWPQLAAQCGPFMQNFAARAQAGAGSAPAFSGFAPKMDVEERPESNETIVTLELPGVPRDTVCLDVTESSLKVSGEHIRSQGTGRLTTQERTFGKFERSLTLPKGVSADDVKAELADGLLTLTFPMRKTIPEQEKTRVPLD
ncbi:HSP20-like chaperone [Auricularia subglabra TFB-10046 SS5]|nr:HSP20-like chaperone [Auricularia subglabra TFB-10046 SS5]